MKQSSLLNLLLALAVVAVTAVAPLTAQTAPSPQRPPASGVALGLAQAMAELRKGDWTAALASGTRAGPVGRDIIEWHRLRAGLGDFEEVKSFLRRRPDWPGLPYLKEKSEEALPHVGDAPDVIAFFADTTPQTGHGVISLVNAFRSIGAEGDAQAEAALAWVDRPMTAEAELVLLRYYPEMLAPLHQARLDSMLWKGATQAARRMLTRLDDPGQTALAEARMALRADRPGIDTLIARVPPALQSDPGLAFERFRWRHAKGRDAEAAALILERSATAALLGQPQVWAPRRRDLARALMREGKVEDAYAVASSHWLEEGSDFADLEWLSGYIQLTYLDDPAGALRHFQKFRTAVATPISLGRAGYWEGRAHEAMGDAEGAANAYAFGAEYQTSFYGLLAAERAGLPMDPTLTGEEVYPPLDQAAFRSSSVLEAALLLQAAGERDLAERFMVHLGETLDGRELGTLADLATKLGEPHLALMIGKQAASVGLTLPRPYYPVVELGVPDMPVPRELALSIARRESEFNAGVSSGVGARGLMQLMPGTAKDMARKLSLPFSRDRLFSDPTYNATLGTAYLAELIGRFGANVVLVSAGYNAGPGRPLRWMEELGDPRSPDVDVVDWIEHVPFDETRNYIMRVAESLPVYRARLTGETEEIRFTEELKAR
ncbi:lytic transglycosylase domain-containing protein [Oceaniglobus roseus]|uniref:lytic transglycosylase domain-containing protein n=1 Tax=Oceaniglobus roseus TaxID=1737570 RepID=UPI000C7EB684|nr:lytic transglycosylase domain-containing protein [Kandeliimicrobium roseum]